MGYLRTVLLMARERIEYPVVINHPVGMDDGELVIYCTVPAGQYTNFLDAYHYLLVRPYHPIPYPP